MKIFIENSSKDSDGLKGKSLFCNRLAVALREKGIQVIDDFNSNADMSLNVIRIKHHRSRVKILRLDGVWHDTAKEFVKKNKTIKASLNEADGVVYQSNFACQMCNKYLGKPKCPSRVIFNGSDPFFYFGVKSIETDRNIIIAFSKWRPHKRLKDIIESFLLANVENGLLVIAGDVTRCGIERKERDKYFTLPNIRWIGNVSQNHLASYLLAAKASVHLCWFDACPNSVVEAIVAGILVICNNVGGTWEIVSPSGGYICDVDSPYDLDPVDLYNPPEIDRSKVAEAIRCSIVETKKINCEHVSIDNVSNQYLAFMKELL